MKTKKSFSELLYSIIIYWVVGEGMIAVGIFLDLDPFLKVISFLIGLSAIIFAILLTKKIIKSAFHGGSTKEQGAGSVKKQFKFYSVEDTLDLLEGANEDSEIRRLMFRSDWHPKVINKGIDKMQIPEIEKRILKIILDTHGYERTYCDRLFTDDWEKFLDSEMKKNLLEAYNKLEVPEFPKGSMDNADKKH